MTTSADRKRNSQLGDSVLCNAERELENTNENYFMPGLSQSKGYQHNP
jgi:hypothetical protein